MQPIGSSRRPLADRAVEQIRDWIASSGLSPGDRLPTESQMIERLEVSRTLLREAIVRLEAIGLVSVRRGQGMFVGDADGLAGCAQLMQTALTFSSSDLIGVAELRCLIEVHAVRRAAELVTNEQMAELEALFKKMGDDSLSYEQAVRADFEFHRQIIKLAGNRLIYHLVGLLHEPMIAAIVETSPNPRVNEFAMERHRSILQAMEDRDPDAAERAMQEHLDLFWTRMVKTDAPGEQPAEGGEVK